MDTIRFDLDRSTSPAVLGIAGDIDLATVDALSDTLDRTLAEDPHVVLDLGDVTFLGAAGMRVFLMAADKLNGSGPLRLVHAERLAWLLDVVGMTTVESIAICETSAHAG